MKGFELVVGGKECPINKIESLVRSLSVNEKWSNIASDLGIPNDSIKRWRKDLLQNNLTPSDVIREMLEAWVALESSGATLGSLVETVEKENELAVGESLRLRFNLPCKGWEQQNPPISFHDLSPAFQTKVSASLSELLPSHDELPNLKSSLQPQLLIDLMTGKKPHLFKATLPKELKYYVNRCLVTRNCLDVKSIFEEKYSSPDVFLFTGISRSELSKLAKNQPTRKSSEQLRNVNVKFIILEHAIHFQKITEVTDNPVHLIHHENGKMRWVKSKGAMQFLQKCVAKNQDQDIILDEYFAKTLKPMMTQQQPICIADTPGMGKSSLLAHIGRQLSNECPDKPVIFMSFNQLIDKIGGASPSKDQIESALGKLVCKTELETELFRKKLYLKSKTAAIELLLDGFDEVHSSKITLAIQILRMIHDSFKLSIRLWITSRPHYLHGIENALNTLGYNIDPFTEDDQVHFLVRFWFHRSEKPLNEQVLKQFAKDCLRNVKSKLNNKSLDRGDVDGIPLQCRMIGEVFEEEAIHASNPEEEHPVEYVSTSTGLISSTADLYKFVITTKLKRYADLYIIDQGQDHAGGWSSQELMEMHMALSLELLFPEHFHKMQNSFKPVEMEDVIKVGIVERAGMDDDATPTFIHRTFAEYFVAWFVFDRMGQGWTEDLTTFLFQGALHCTKMDYESLVNEVWEIEDAKAKMRRLDSNRMSKEGPGADKSGSKRKDQYLASYKFTHPVISHFLNAFLKTRNDQTLIIGASTPLSRDLNLDDDEPTYLKQVAYASAYHDHLDILLFFNKLGLLEKHAKSIFSGGFMIIVVLKSCLEFLKISFDYFKRHNNKDLTEESGANVLEVALLRGDFSIVEFLLKEKQLRELVEEYAGRKVFVHQVVKGTAFNSEEQLNQRIEILRMLTQNNPPYHVKQKGTDDKLPLFCQSVHVKLAIELVTNLGANVLDRDGEGNTLIHMNKNTSHYTKGDYHSLLQSIPLRKLKILVKVVGQYGHSPLSSVFAFFDPKPETIELFHKAGADFNYMCPEKYSVLFYAIFHGRGDRTLEKLIELGADPRHRGQKGDSLLHTATMSGNMDAVRVLLKHKCDINAVADGGGTPLDLLLFSDSPRMEEMREELGPLLKEMGGEFDVKVNGRGETLLHVASKRGRISSVKLLLEWGFSSNAVNEVDNTPLHLAVEADDDEEIKTKTGSIFDLVKILLDHEANPNLLNKDGETAFTHAMKNFVVDLPTFQLLEAETVIRWSPELAYTSLNYILSRDYFNKSLDQYTLNRLIRGCIDHGADVNFIGEEDGLSLLHFAAFNNNKLGVKLLVEYGADLDVRSRGNGRRTPLHMAALAKEINWEQIEIMKFLIDNGADVYCQDGGGETFLHGLIMRQDAPITPKQFHEIVEYLIGRKLSGLILAGAGELDVSPLQLAFQRLELEEETLYLLHSNKVDFNKAVDGNGRGLLSYSVIGGRSMELMTSLIVDFGVDWKRLNNNGNSLLHTSASYGNLEALKYFLDLGDLDMNGVDGQGDTPLHCVMVDANRNILEMTRALVGKGADVTIRNNERLTPLEIAMRRAHPEWEGREELLDMLK